jgi:predicted transposase/invertase (TIGR01784 family)
VKLDRDELANVEMTIFPRNFEPIRLEYYLARLFSGQDIQGTGRSFGNLTRTYQIALTGSRRIYHDEALVHRFEYYDRETGTSLGGRTKIIVVELEKAESSAGKPATELSGEEKWALFLRYAKERERRNLVNELLREEEGIAMAGEVLLTVSRDEIERARLDSEYEGRLDRQAERADARQEGWEEGLAEGREEGRQEGMAKGLTEGMTKGREEGFKIAKEAADREVRENILASARKLKDMGFPPDKIAVALGLTTEEIGGL